MTCHLYSLGQECFISTTEDVAGIADRVTQSATLARGMLVREPSQFESVRLLRTCSSLYDGAYSFRPRASIPILFPLSHILAREINEQIATRSRRVTYHASNTGPSIERLTFPPFS